MGGEWKGESMAREEFIPQCSLAVDDTDWDELQVNKHVTILCCVYTGWAKLNKANAVSLVVVKHVLENFDNFRQVKKQFSYAL